ncbi:MarR family transcriptional regulator [Clostridium estertheticum]|uniref:MarR family transcriptional regulator n=1 Tax=Clostridium estertheticum TaxID=238834 RepID=A0A5N7IJM8_9CLOT|nr:MarR family transcriptional regulator [Clostridium estertheticum]MPQ30513.1 MarR family transcriptional regulator [Clostridium estertheticum]MPQ61189.1 MarR family transcriptional regulator [Clostridium estertheticum]
MHNSISEKLLQQFHYFTNLINRGRQQQSFGVHEINLGRGQGHLLGVLITNDGLTQKELSTQLRIRPTSLGELVSKLEQSNYVERRVNENDKRASNIYITEEGRKIVNEIMKERQVVINNMFIILSEDEKQQLLALMGKLITAMEENMDDNDNEEYENNKDQRNDRGNDSI